MEKWSIEKANAWYGKTPWPVGFNFLPKSACNSTEMFQKESYDPEEIEKELRLASQTGFNSCRVFFPYIVWSVEGEAFLDRVEGFLNLAQRYGLSVMPVLFDDCAFAGKEPYYGKQCDPVPGVHNSQWTPSPGFQLADDEKAQGKLEAYIEAVIGRFASNPAVLAWDLYNEPGNSGRGEKSLPLLYRTFAWARACNPTQPLTSGLWSFAEYESAFARLSDIVSYHDYQPLAISKARIRKLTSYQRPLFCTEWLHRPEQNTIETHLPYYKEKRIGSYSWGLVAGRTQTNLSWATMNTEPEPNPSVWQHDLFYSDGRAYQEKEIALIKRIVNA